MGNVSGEILIDNELAIKIENIFFFTKFSKYIKTLTTKLAKV